VHKVHTSVTLVYEGSEACSMHPLVPMRHPQKSTETGITFLTESRSLVQPIADRVAQNLEIIFKTFLTNQNSAHGIYE